MSDPLSGPWNKAALEWLDRARRGSRKFLHDLDGSYFIQREPIVSSSCADYKRNYDMIRYIASLRGFEPGEDHRTHRLGWHGGITRIVEGSPMNMIPRTDEMFLAELLEAHKITGLLDYVVYAHWPCSKFLEHHLTIEDAADHLMRAKIRLKKINPSFKVKTLFHVDPPEGFLSTPGMKSYFADPDDYATFMTA